MAQFLAWLKSLFKGKREYIPDTPEVSREAYFQAWRDILDLPQGKILLAYFRFSLWQVASETSPLNLDSSESKAIWLAGHDARMRVLLDIVKEATHNLELAPKPRQEWEAPSNQR